MNLKLYPFCAYMVFLHRVPASTSLWSYFGENEGEKRGRKIKLAFHIIIGTRHTDRECATATRTPFARSHNIFFCTLYSISEGIISRKLLSIFWSHTVAQSDGKNSVCWLKSQYFTPTHSGVIKKLLIFFSIECIFSENPYL